MCINEKVNGYYFVHNKEESYMICPRCGSIMSGGVCPECGFPNNCLKRILKAIAHVAKHDLLPL